MSRLLTDESIGEHERDVMNWIDSKTKEINNMKVPDFMQERIAKGYYDGDLAGSSLKEMRNFWKIPDSSDKMLDSMIDRAKIFSAGYTGGVIGLGTQANTAFNLIDFSDSDSAIDKGNLLYNYLTKDEQAQADSDDDWQTGTQVLGVIGGILTGQPEVVMAAVNQGTRETVQETLGFRNPELLENAVKRFQDDMQKQEEVKRQIKLTKMALEDIKQEYEQAQLSAEIAQKTLQPVMNQIIENTSRQMKEVPHFTHAPSSQHIPVNLARGRGFGMSSLAPESLIYERTLASGLSNIFRHTDMIGVRY